MATSCPNSPPSQSPPPFSKQTRFSFSTRSWMRSRMSSDRSLPPVPDRRVVLGCGSVSVDLLAVAASYPKPDDKIRSTSLKVFLVPQLKIDFLCLVFVLYSSFLLHLSLPSILVSAIPQVCSKVSLPVCYGCLEVQGGGNVTNALTCTARLGLNPRLISKVAEDARGRGIMEELEADGVDTSLLVVSSDRRFN